MQFLEAKGLSGPEIEEAMRQAAVNQNTLQTPSQPYLPVYSPVYGPAPYGAQLVQPWDWRDYFVSRRSESERKQILTLALDYRCYFWRCGIRRCVSFQSTLSGMEPIRLF